METDDNGFWHSFTGSQQGILWEAVMGMPVTAWRFKADYGFDAGLRTTVVLYSKKSTTGESYASTIPLQIPSHVTLAAPRPIDLRNRSGLGRCCLGGSCSRIVWSQGTPIQESSPPLAPISNIIY